MTRAYISGPMTGLPGFNYAAFNQAAKDLREKGFEVLNPAENFGGATNHPEGRKAFMRLDMQHVLEAEIIFVLPGWNASPGARLEVAVARELGLDVLDIDTHEPPTDESILEEAQRLVHGNRGQDYGHPIEDFTRSGRMWGAILGTDDVPPDKVAMCMIAVKLSREVNRDKRDNRVDMAGYAETLDMVRQRQNET